MLPVCNALKIAPISNCQIVHMWHCTSKVDFAKTNYPLFLLAFKDHSYNIYVAHTQLCKLLTGGSQFQHETKFNQIECNFG